MPTIEWSDNNITVCGTNVQMKVDWKKGRIVGITILDSDKKEEVLPEESEALPPFHYPCENQNYWEYKAPLDSQVEKPADTSPFTYQSYINYLKEQEKKRALEEEAKKLLPLSPPRKTAGYRRNFGGKTC